MKPRTMQKINCAVCIFIGEGVEERFLGSGYLVEPGLVITCSHNFKNTNGRELTQDEIEGTQIFVASNPGDPVVRAREVVLNLDLDIALLKLVDEIDDGARTPALLVRIEQSFMESYDQYKYEYTGFKKIIHQSKITSQELPLPIEAPRFSRGSFEAVTFNVEVLPGGSGGPILIAVGDKKYCIGIAKDSARKTTIATSSDRIMEFLNETDIVLNNKIKARYVFNGFLRFMQQLSVMKYVLFAAVIGVIPYRLWFHGQPPTHSVVSATVQKQETTQSAPVKKLLVSSAPTARLPEDECHRKVFEDKPSLKVLVLPFNSANQDSTAIANGQSYAEILAWRLRKYEREEENTDIWKKAELPGGLQVIPAKCPVKSHPQARVIGRAMGADLVIWGQVTLRDVPRSTNDASVFTPCITAVYWHSLEAEAPKSIELRKSDNLQGMTFPQLATKEPFALVQFMLGLYAQKYQRSELAFYFLQKIKPENFVILNKSRDMASLQSDIGKIYVQSGHLNQGIQKIHEALNQCPEKDIECKADMAGTLGWAYERENLTYSKAMAAWALRLAKQTNNEHTRTAALAHAVMNGILPYSLETINSLNDILISSVHKDKECKLMILYAMVFLNEQMHRFEDAISYCKQALMVLGNDEEYLEAEALLKYRMGELLVKEGKVAASIPHYNEAIQSMRKVGDLYGEIFFIASRAESYGQTLRLNEALLDYDVVFNYWKKNAHPANELLTNISLAVIYEENNRLKSSIAQLENCARLIPKVDSVEIRVHYYRNLGIAYLNDGQYQKAYLFLGKAIVLLPKNKDGRFVPNILYGYAKSAEHLGYLREALQFYKEAASAFTDLLDRDNARISLQSAYDLARQADAKTSAADIIAEAQRLGIAELTIH